MAVAYQCQRGTEQSVVVWQRYHLGGEKMTKFLKCDVIAARVDGIKSLDPAGVPWAR